MKHNLLSLQYINVNIYFKQRKMGLEDYNIWLREFSNTNTTFPSLHLFSLKTHNL